jgi:hypothetical protein
MKKSKKLWIFIGIMVVFNLTIYLTKLGGDKVLLYVSDLLPVLCSLISALCLFSVYKNLKEFDSAKIAWMMILIGITLDFIAESTYSVLEIGFAVDINEVFPTVADYIWCAAYIPLFIGLIIMFLGYRRSGMPMGKIKLYGILLPIILILFSAVIYLLLIPIIKDDQTELIDKVFYLFYPIGDLFIVFPTLVLMYITSLFGKGIITKPWKYLAFGFICFTVADLLFSYLSWLDLYGSGSPIDVVWNVGYLFIGLSGLYQTELIQSIKGDTNE